MQAPPPTVNQHTLVISVLDFGLYFLIGHNLEFPKAFIDIISLILQRLCGVATSFNHSASACWKLYWGWRRGSQDTGLSVLNAGRSGQTGLSCPCFCHSGQRTPEISRTAVVPAHMLLRGRFPAFDVYWILNWDVAVWCLKNDAFSCLFFTFLIHALGPELDPGRKTQNPAAFKDCIIWCQWSQGDIRTTIDPPGVSRAVSSTPCFCFGFCLLVCLDLRQGLLCLKLASDWLSFQEWFWMSDPPASTSQVVRFQVYNSAVSDLGGACVC